MPLPCFCQVLTTKSRKVINYLDKTEGKGSGEGDLSEIADSDCQLPEVIEVGKKVSSGEISRLTAENWCLKNSLNDAEHANENMQDLVKKVVKEKYETLDELHKLTRANEMLQRQLMTERNLYADEKRKLLEENVQLKDKNTEQQVFIVRFLFLSLFIYLKK